ncbi:MAG TPA: hypothetical protein VMU08_01075 [Rhizomicrobium sp.]|nr:hypothetical protein [Rhizomicrobium sp.]
MSLLYDVTVRFWDELVARPSGPLAFRFILQPAMATLLAVRDGFADAHAQRLPYFWLLLHDSPHRADRLREGFRAVLRVILLGLAMDAVYQVIELKAFRPTEMLVVTFVLAFLPYLLVRGPIDRLVSWWRRRADESHRAPLRQG